MFIISSAASSVFLHLKKDSETLLVHGFIFVETSQVTYVTMVPRVGNETLRPLGVATGNASSMTRV